MIITNHLCHAKGAIYLRSLTENDCTEQYVSWLNDTKVNQYLESKWKTHNLKSTLDFVNKMNASLDNYLLGIFLADGDRHVGNIKIGPVSSLYKNAAIGYMIGEKDCWNRGIATGAIEIACKFAFDTIGLHRLEAGTYAAAKGSQRALEKNGFIREGTARESVSFDGIYMDVYKYGLLREDYEK